MGITFDTKCKKCGVTLRRQALLAMVIDAGAQTLDPALCPEGGDHQFEDDEQAYDTFRREQIAKRNWNQQNKEGDYD